MIVGGMMIGGRSLDDALNFPSVDNRLIFLDDDLICGKRDEEMGVIHRQALTWLLQI